MQLTMCIEKNCVNRFHIYTERMKNVHGGSVVFGNAVEVCISSDKQVNSTYTSTKQTYPLLSATISDLEASDMYIFSMALDK